jgi:hypothetical protein
MKQIEAAESRFNAGVSSSTPTRQIFEQLVQKHGGDRVKAQMEYNQLFGEKNDLSTLGVKAGLEALYKKKADVVSSSLPPDMVAKQTAAIDAEIAKLTGGSRPSGGKIITEADIKATAAKQGMTEKQVRDAALAKGYVIQ